MSNTPKDHRIAAWLNKKRATWILLRLLAAIALLAVGAVALFVTFWVTYGVSWFVLRYFDLGSSVYTWISAIFLVLLFIGNARTDREYLNEISLTTGTYSDKIMTFYMPGVGIVSNINPLAPDTIHSGAKMITTLLYTGPRAVMAALRMIRKAYRLIRLDTRQCGAVMAFLHARPGRAAFENIVRAVPGIDPTRTFPQVGDIAGVLFLGGDPPGLTLSSQLRGELDHLTA
jgi:hypothetical protein